MVEKDWPQRAFLHYGIRVKFDAGQRFIRRSIYVCMGVRALRRCRASACRLGRRVATKEDGGRRLTLEIVEADARLEGDELRKPPRPSSQVRAETSPWASVSAWASSTLPYMKPT